MATLISYRALCLTVLASGILTPDFNQSNRASASSHLDVDLLSILSQPANTSNSPHYHSIALPSHSFSLSFARFQYTFHAQGSPRRLHSSGSSASSWSHFRQSRPQSLTLSRNHHIDIEYPHTWLLLHDCLAPTQSEILLLAATLVCSLLPAGTRQPLASAKLTTTHRHFHPATLAIVIHQLLYLRSIFRTPLFLPSHTVSPLLQFLTPDSVGFTIKPQSSVC